MLLIVKQFLPRPISSCVLRTLTDMHNKEKHRDQISCPKTTQHIQNSIKPILSLYFLVSSVSFVHPSTHSSKLPHPSVVATPLSVKHLILDSRPDHQIISISYSAATFPISHLSSPYYIVANHLVRIYSTTQRKLS